MLRSTFIAVAAICILLLSGCSREEHTPVVDATTSTTTEKTETITTTAVESSIPETFPPKTSDIPNEKEHTYSAIMDIKNFSTNNPYLPCKSLYVTADEKGYPVNTLFVTLWNDETLSFPLPIEDNSYLDLNSVDFANLDEDEEQEIIVSCWFGFYYMGIYVLDISSNTFLPVPVLADTEELPGVDYQVTNNSYQTMTISNDKTGFSEKINLEEILTANYAKKKQYISYSENEYKNAYNSSDSDSCYVTYWSGRYSIEMYEEQECLVLEQPITGAWGQNDGIGFVETGMRWDEEGSCELLFSRYALPDKHDS